MKKVEITLEKETYIRFLAELKEAAINGHPMLDYYRTLIVQNKAEMRYTSRELYTKYVQAALNNLTKRDNASEKRAINSLITEQKDRLNAEWSYYKAEALKWLRKYGRVMIDEDQFASLLAAWAGDADNSMHEYLTTRYGKYYHDGEMYEGR